MSLVSCKNAKKCICEECVHKEPHENGSECRDFPNGCCCVPVKEFKVICNKADECSLEYCDHRNLHVENGGCVDGKCNGLEGESRCVPYIGGACGEVEIVHHFTLTPELDHPEANIKIQANTRTEALEKALNQLGWKLL
jgi:hypothetical protein